MDAERVAGVGGGTLVRLVSRTPSAGSFSVCRATADGGGG